jgi:hypothetical protein
MSAIMLATITDIVILKQGIVQLWLETVTPMSVMTMKVEGVSVTLTFHFQER